MAPIVSCDNLVRIYKTEETEVLALQGLDISIDQGELVAIIGASGSGKSTIARIMAGLFPSAFNLFVDGKKIPFEQTGDLITFAPVTVKKELRVLRV